VRRTARGNPPSHRRLCLRLDLNWMLVAHRGRGIARCLSRGWMSIGILWSSWDSSSTAGGHCPSQCCRTNCSGGGLLEAVCQNSGGIGEQDGKGWGPRCSVEKTWRIIEKRTSEGNVISSIRTVHGHCGCSWILVVAG